MKVSLFVTCLADNFFPEVGEAVVALLEKLGVEVDFPQEQTCCGQPFIKLGHYGHAREIAERFMKVFADAELIVAPSGSCVYTVRHAYPLIFENDPKKRAQAIDIGTRTYEFCEFMVNILKVEDLGASWDGSIFYHPSCQLSRGLKVEEEPLRLLKNVKGIRLVHIEKEDSCCGFGGAFSVQYPEISQAIVREKVEFIKEAGADVVVSGDMGCLMNIGGMIKRMGLDIKTMHIAQLLAGNFGNVERGGKR